MKFRKKAHVVEAFKWEGSLMALQKWLNATGYGESSCVVSPEPIRAREIYMNNPVQKTSSRACIGDYIVRGIRGCYYAVQADLFLELYEEVSDEREESETDSPGSEGASSEV